eukprot:CAMPEP_0206228838 /NCGR_PEP_ID=MMETSP0047_2-20121206/9377_1 /ASSEMBLY_ACC=CAM_ASM_000192 /TAXON_ID=195065 /ORGANISM="Chroomonas mesostigmatica_cf, Strain CCMP1168" /LENGTH=267 /DNA_ID=CAMNT_0053652097 /DNA_START=31 /DNA_END=834 /DNA_ORIENTATION=+
MSEAPIKVGMLGTGTIVGHVVCGLLRPEAVGVPLAITVSPRSKAKAEELKAKFPDRVTIAADNQAVIDSSDVVCLGVTPQVCESVLSEVKFREDQLVISFLSTARIEDLSRMVAPAKMVLRAIPMPPIARGLGPLPTHPPNETFDAIFARTGAIVALEKEDELACMMSTSAMMATYYEFEGTAHKWLVKQGLPSKACTKYIGSLFLALATDASNEEDGFDKIVSESQTPGGINQQVLTNLKEKEGWFEKLGAELDLILARVTGKPKA